MPLIVCTTFRGVDNFMIGNDVWNFFGTRDFGFGNFAARTICTNNQFGGNLFLLFRIMAEVFDDWISRCAVNLFKCAAIECNALILSAVTQKFVKLLTVNHANKSVFNWNIHTAFGG